MKRGFIVIQYECRLVSSQAGHQEIGVAFTQGYKEVAWSLTTPGMANRQRAAGKPGFKCSCWLALMPDRCAHCSAVREEGSHAHRHSDSNNSREPYKTSRSQLWPLQQRWQFDDTVSRFSPRTTGTTPHGGHRLCVLKLQICACRGRSVHRLCWRSCCLCTHTSTCTVPLVYHAPVRDPCCELIGPAAFKVILKWHTHSLPLSPTHILMCLVLIFWPAGFPSLPSLSILRSQLMVHY